MPVLKQQDYWIVQSTKDVEASFESQYEFGKELGRSLTSSVFKCQKRGLSQTWSVKVLNKNVDKKVKWADVGVLLRLEYKNLIRLKEIFESKTKIFLVQELVTGGELFDRIVNVGKYTETVAAKAVSDIVAGLQYLHSHGIVHRNLKPENLLYENLSEDSPLKLADFGLSTVISPEIDMISVCGTPVYTAPEVLKGERNNTPGDMWAVGVITYILLCGYEPFQDEDPCQLFKKILKGQYEFSTGDWQKAGSNAMDVIRKLLHPDPKKRMTSTGASRNLWVMGFATRTDHLDETVERIKEFNDKRKDKFEMMPVSQTPRSRAVSRMTVQPSPLSLPETPVPSIEITNHEEEVEGLDEAVVSRHQQPDSQGVSGTATPNQSGAATPSQSGAATPNQSGAATPSQKSEQDVQVGNRQTDPDLTAEI